jgi:peptidoglycan L-alanyl-D-glutamate endopeptidase CwlK
MNDLKLLKPKPRMLAGKLVEKCLKTGISIKITCTYRSIEEQNRLYAQGRTRPGKIVTCAKGGFSLHNYGVAFDFCPLVKGKAAWNDIGLFDRVGKIGISLGLEWGGSWKRFRDRCHFQYTAGYSLEDFRKNRINWKKFEA